MIELDEYREIWPAIQTEKKAISFNRVDSTIKNQLKLRNLSIDTTLFHLHHLHTFYALTLDQVTAKYQHYDHYFGY